MHIYWVQWDLSLRQIQDNALNCLTMQFCLALGQLKSLELAIVLQMCCKTCLQHLWVEEVRAGSCTNLLLLMQTPCASKLPVQDGGRVGGRYFHDRQVDREWEEGPSWYAGSHPHSWIVWSSQSLLWSAPSCGTFGGGTALSRLIGAVVVLFRGKGKFPLAPQ